MRFRGLLTEDVWQLFYGYVSLLRPRLNSGLFESLAFQPNSFLNALLVAFAISHPVAFAKLPAYGATFRQLVDRDTPLFSPLPHARLIAAAFIQELLVPLRFPFSLQIAC